MRGFNHHWAIINYEIDEQECTHKIAELYKQSKLIDCRINAFPYNTKHTINFDVKNKTAATLIMIDLDSHQFNDDESKLNKYLQVILKKINSKFKGAAHPTVLHTGNGYHIYQPIDGIIFERYQKFYDFLPYLNGRDLTTEFTRFAEKFFLGNKVDPNHRPSIKNCMLRIPGTINSKNGKEVTIIQRWDGQLPSIKWIASDFFDYLIDVRSKEIQKRLMSKTRTSNNKKVSNIDWIERLLQTGIDDYRKDCLWRIVSPYLINVKGLSSDEAKVIIKQWLDKCDRVKKLGFDPSELIKSDLKGVKSYYPPGQETLKQEHPKLFQLLNSMNIIS